MALYTGARRGELLAARWDQVDPRRGLLTLPTSKSGKPRYIELSSKALAVLAKVPRHVDSPLIFPECRKVTHRFPVWAEEAKLPGRVTLHTLRHTYASRLVLAGVDVVTIRELGGGRRRVGSTSCSGTPTSGRGTSGQRWKPWPGESGWCGVAPWVTPSRMKLPRRQWLL